MISDFFKEIHGLLDKVLSESYESMSEAASMIAETLKDGGKIHLFGSGHSHIISEEVYYRAGGLVSLHPILHEPLMLHQDAIKSTEFERVSGYAEEILSKENLKQDDLMLVISNSGKNPVPIEAAEIAKKRGLKTIAMMSLVNKSGLSRHKASLFLSDVVDVTIDTQVPLGDALMSHPKLDTKFSPASTIVGATIIQAVIAQAIECLVESGHVPAIFKSANVDASDEHNKEIIDQFDDFK